MASMENPQATHDSHHCNPLDKSIIADLKNEIISELP